MAVFDIKYCLDSRVIRFCYAVQDFRLGGIEAAGLQQGSDAQDPLTAINCPPHPRPFHPLRGRNLAGGFDGPGPHDQGSGPQLMIAHAVIVALEEGQFPFEIGITGRGGFQNSPGRRDDPADTVRMLKQEVAIRFVPVRVRGMVRDRFEMLVD